MLAESVRLHEPNGNNKQPAWYPCRIEKQALGLLVSTLNPGLDGKGHQFHHLSVTKSPHVAVPPVFAAIAGRPGVKLRGTFGISLY